MKYPDDIWKQITNANCVETALQLGLELDEKNRTKRQSKLKALVAFFYGVMAVVTTITQIMKEVMN